MLQHHFQNQELDRALEAFVSAICGYFSEDLVSLILHGLLAIYGPQVRTGIFLYRHHDSQADTVPGIRLPIQREPA